MKIEIITDPLTKNDVLHDLNANIALMKRLGVKEVLLFFGFSWGKLIYEDKWKDIPISPEDINDLMYRVEKQGFGELANDNLYISISQFNLRLQYSHEADIHLSFQTPNTFVKRILTRWTEKGWLCYSKSKEKAVISLLSEMK